jgi:hypothetical protein
VVVALGDNYSSAVAFQSMLQKIKASGKNCIWVMPSKKIGNNTEAQKSIAAYTGIAKSLCGERGSINPSADGTSYQTGGDRVHYIQSEAAKIGQKICRQLTQVAVIPSSHAPAVSAQAGR